MPFGKKSSSEGVEIDFDLVYRDLLGNLCTGRDAATV